MKGNIKSFICGMLVMGVISCAGVYAADVWQNINVLPNTIKVVVDGKEVQADNFLYNDTTYLPIRAVSEALGKDVQYDTQTSTAYKTFHIPFHKNTSFVIPKLYHKGIIL